jgi:putative membrane protein insertion efficiency factor
VTRSAQPGPGLLLRALAAPLLALLWLYQRFISPALGPACRYYPSCSHYAVEAIRMRGPLAGPLLAVRRLLRCHPWAEGGIDPVPPPRRVRRIPS